jgi:phosphoserine phosphatase RsbU/P
MIRTYTQFLLLTLCAALCAATTRAQQSLVINGLGHATAPLDGTWQFHIGDDLAWASPAYDDSAWQPIQVGRTWETQGHRNYTGFAWYRRHIVINNSAGIDLGLLLPRVENSCDVYWNGVLIGSYGRVSPHPVWYENPLYRSFPLRPPYTGVLAIRVWKAPHIAFSDAQEGGLVSIPLVGNSAALAAQKKLVSYAWLRASLYGLTLMLLTAIVAMLALLGWLRDRRQWMLFWLALCMIHPLAIIPFADIPGSTYIPGLLDFRWSYGLVALAVGIGDISLWFLLLYLLGLRENNRLVRWTFIMAIIDLVFNGLDGSLQLFDWIHWPNRLFLALDIGFTIPALLIEAYALVLIVFAFRKRLDAARWFLAIAALTANLTLAFGNWFSLGMRWTHNTLANQFSVPLFSIFGSQFSALTLADTFLFAAILYAAWRYSAEQSSRQSRLEQEFRSAQEVQRLLIPANPPATPGFSVETVYLPAAEVGGDFFHIQPASDGSLLIIAGDVSGKGLKAAMTVSAIIGALRNEPSRQPATVLRNLNRILHGHITGFAACTAALISASGEMILGNAGNLAPYLNGKELPLESGLPLGILADTTCTEATRQLNPNDRLTFVSDGVVEAANPQRELFGFDRTQAISTQPAAAIASAAQTFGQQDDISVISITLHPQPAAAMA